MNNEKRPLAYVKLVDAYVENLMLLCRVAEAISDGEIVKQDKVAALIRDTECLSKRIESMTGKKPVDASAGFTIRGIRFTGAGAECTVEEARVVVRQCFYQPADLTEYEQAVFLYYATRNNLCRKSSATAVA